METNERGNQITRHFRPDLDRYAFDFKRCPSADGWIQYDTQQDAWYFGVWVNPRLRRTLTFAEGDITVVDCPTEESYHAELASMAEFYGDPPPFARTIDEDGTVTAYYEDRPT